MKANRVGILLVVGMLLAFAGLALAQDHSAPHWTYDGEEGPENWGELAPEFALCGEGRAQSPIDIHDAQSANLADIAFDYAEVPLAIFNNGHTIQVNYAEGSSITYNENTYALAQFHFHHPSEHTIGGQPAAMEIHFVHKDAAGNLAVVGVMLVEGAADNAAYAPIFDNLPAEQSDPAASPAESINAADLLPAEALYFTYTGSLTTPPCSQGVRWLVLTEPIELSAAQIEAFAAIFEGNARPVQPLNERDLLEDSSAG